MNPYRAYIDFVEQFHAALQASAVDPEVAGFKSIACYRTGLDIGLVREGQALEHCVTMVELRYEAQRNLRLADKVLNDYIVNVTLRIAGECGKPGEPHWSSYLYCPADTSGVQSSFIQASVTTTLRSHVPRLHTCSR